ncbi:MAG: hypothetical protein IPM14_00490 [bacterium]|nr:hypothetical protein [bacterium]
MFFKAIIEWHTGWIQPATNNYSGRTMTTFFILLGVLLTSIIITFVQIRSSDKKEMEELNQLFEDVPLD